jgi:hypothetical protein
MVVRRTFVVLVTMPLLLAAADREEVPLEIRDGGYLHVRVRLAESLDATLMLDTGAGITTLAPDVIRALGTSARETGRHTGTRHNGETVTGPVWTVSSLRLGPVIQHDAVVGAFAPAGADGLLSLDFFRDVPFTLDFARSRLAIETAASLSDVERGAAIVPLRLRAVGAHQIDAFVDVCVGDLRAEAELDTGAGYAMMMLHPSYMARLGLAPPRATARGPFEYYVYSTTLPEVHYCAAPTVATTHQFAGFKEGLIYDALIGHGAFRGRRVTLDIPRQRLLVH